MLRLLFGGYQSVCLRWFLSIFWMQECLWKLCLNMICFCLQLVVRLMMWCEDGGSWIPGPGWDRLLWWFSGQCGVTWWLMLTCSCLNCCWIKLRQSMAGGELQMSSLCVCTQTKWWPCDNNKTTHLALVFIIIKRRLTSWAHYIIFCAACFTAASLCA